MIGVGSPLRGDDAAGRAVAERIAGLDLPGIESRSVHQLTPELAADWLGRRTVVIVDADVEVADVTVRTIERPAASAVLTHHVDPAALLALAALLGDPPQHLEIVSLPVHDLALGTELSTPAAAAVERAVELLRERCTQAPA